MIRAAGTFVSVYFPDILCFAITSSVFWCKSIYWLRNTSVAAYFCSKYDQGFSDGFHGLTSWTLDLSSQNGPWFPGSISEQILIQSPHRSSYGQKHGHELSSAQHGQSNDFVSCGHWQPFQNWNHFQNCFKNSLFKNFSLNKQITRKKIRSGIFEKFPNRNFEKFKSGPEVEFVKSFINDPNAIFAWTSASSFISLSLFSSKQ